MKEIQILLTLILLVILFKPTKKGYFYDRGNPTTSAPTQRKSNMNGVWLEPVGGKDNPFIKKDLTTPKEFPTDKINP